MASHSWRVYTCTPPHEVEWYARSTLRRDYSDHITARHARWPSEASRISVRTTFSHNLGVVIGDQFAPNAPRNREPLLNAWTWRIAFPVSRKVSTILVQHAYDSGSWRQLARGLPWGRVQQALLCLHSRRSLMQTKGSSAKEKRTHVTTR